MTVGMGGMGPRQAMEAFGDSDGEGAFFSQRVVSGMLAFLKPYWRQMLLGFVCMLAATVLTLLNPFLVKVAIDDYITPGDLDGLRWVVLGLLFGYSGFYVATALETYILSWVSQRVLANLRETLFRHLQRLSLGYHDKSIVGVTVSRVINDVSVINDLISQGFITLMGDMLILVGIAGVMIVLNWQLALLTFLVTPLMVVATFWFSAKAKPAYRDTRAQIAALVGNIAEAIAAMRVIQAFAQEETALGRFLKINVANRDAQVKAMSLSFTFLPTVEFLSTLGTAIVLLFGGLAVMNGWLTLGVLVAFLAYVARLFAPVRELTQLYSTMQSAMAGGEQVLDLLATEPDVPDAEGAQDLPPIVGQVVYDGVSFQYRPDTPKVLDDINLTIEAGQTVALVGPTGAGKSTIASLLMRFYDATEGVVRIDGIDIRTVRQQSLRAQTGVVAQDPFLFSGTIAENIAFGRPDSPRAAVELAGRMANADEFIQGLPDGYETDILEGGANLSVGQRQLLSIARAILADPRILILDEATANIDTLTEMLIQQALDALLEGRTAVVIAHRLSTIRKADLICVIDDGQIVERGTHSELLTAGGLYRLLYEKQFMRDEVV